MHRNGFPYALNTRQRQGAITVVQTQLEHVAIRSAEVTLLGVIGTALILMTFGAGL